MGIVDKILDPKRRKLDKKPMNSQVAGHTLTPEQVADLKAIQNNKR